VGMALGTRSLAAFFRHGSVVVLDGTRTRGHLDSGHERLADTSGESVLLRQTSLLLPAVPAGEFPALPTLASGAVLTVDDVAWEVREVVPEDDGLLVRAILVPA
jgi:hypothetical protein